MNHSRAAEGKLLHTVRLTEHFTTKYETYLTETMTFPDSFIDLYSIDSFYIYDIHYESDQIDNDASLVWFEKLKKVHTL